MATFSQGIMALAGYIQQKRATSEILYNSDYIPAAGEIIVATDTGQIKAGDGIHTWTQLPASDGTQIANNYTETTTGKALDAVKGNDLNTRVIKLDTRIETIENAISQILLALEDVNQYPDYMNFIVENFNDTNQIDTFSADITSITQDSNSISVENISGMLPLSWYVISDGLTSERVQVSSININNGVNNVILTAPVENNYNLDNVKLYRTSALINTGSATSYGILLSKLWLAELIWRGLMSDETFSVGNVVNATNYDLFSFTGQATFTADNYFCLGE